MTLRNVAFGFAFCGWMLASTAGAADQIQLANNPALSPDASQLAFDWNGDIWIVPSTGGSARALTQNPARDSQPFFSPDGKQIAFISDRTGSPQAFTMPVEGGTPKQLTFHTGGCALRGWTPDGQRLLIRASRDHDWRHADRFFFVSSQDRSIEEPLFDDYGNHASLSPDRSKLLFTREGIAWWRKGYHGSQASQLWMYNLGDKSFTKLDDDERGCTYPMWRPDGQGYYCVSAKSGTFNVHEVDLSTNKNRQLTQFKDDSVVQPCLSANGSVMVFRHLFDLYRFKPGSSEPPQKLTIRASGDRTDSKVDRRTLTNATRASFTKDGLEIAMTAGGDLWVMDTELREPKQFTNSAEEERDPVWSPDGTAIYYVSDVHGECNLWKAERADPSKYWWQNSEFKRTRLTQDAEAKSNIVPSPDGLKLAFTRSRGDLWVMDSDGKNSRRLIASFGPTDGSWSPDGKWLVYTADDNDFNRDVWITPIDGSRPPFNLSRHPFNESDPVWSPDGKVIAFVGRRDATESDVHFVFLRADDNEVTTKDRSLEKAIDKMVKGRRPATRPTPNTPTDGDGRPAGEAVPPVVIDFDGIHDRIRRVSIPDSSENELFFSPDSKRLAFSASVDGKRAVYAIDIPDDLRPKQLIATAGSRPKWLRNNQVVSLVAGIPTSFSTTPTASGATTPLAPRTGGRATAPPTAPTTSTAPPAEAGTGYRFQALQVVDVARKNSAVFDLSWRTMRDNFYDERLGNRNWAEIRMKYLDAAANAPDVESVGTVVSMMLGELNGSHLGFTPTAAGAAGPPGRRGAPTDPETATARWNDTTHHLGLRFAPNATGQQLVIRDILPGGPADLKKLGLKAGDIVEKIDGTVVTPTTDLVPILTGPPAKEFVLTVKSGASESRDVTIRPTSFTAARQLLYKKWIADNRAMVEKLSNGKLGYLHIDAMSMPSFYKFEAELYSAGAGKEGLVIDVRENGGGSTADHLLTTLCQPRHAIAVPRGGGPGYPQDRIVYATWTKPIAVMCNQNSFSNAEIFSHAVKTLKRGQVVGVPTAGGVISTGGTTIMDAGFLRLPFRGWYKIDDGKDMELNGAVPHHIVWPLPGEKAKGIDRQIEMAVKVLRDDVVAFKAIPQPQLLKASEQEAKTRVEVKN